MPSSRYDNICSMRQFIPMRGWTEEYTVELRQVERYWEAREDLVATLNEDVIPSFIPRVEDEEQPTNGGSSSSGDTTGIGLTSHQPSMSLSRMAQATHAALSVVGDPPIFKPLCLFIAHIEVEYGRIRGD